MIHDYRFREVETLKIQYIDRETNEIKDEKVAGERYLKWLYDSSIGMSLLELLIKKGIFSYLYGKLQDTSISKRKILSFIRNYDIDMNDFAKCLEDYKSFNDFFCRKLKTGVRPLDDRVDRLISPADGRLLAYENIDINALIQIKGSTYTLEELIGDKSLAESFNQGCCLIVRLCPTDYHRFHFPDAGLSEEARSIKGDYYSVNPIALKTKARLYCRNKRHFTIFHSSNFDDILLIEVGATCVGSIVQTFIPNQYIAKGDEKGFFKFGGSTVIMFLKPGRIQVDRDILVNTEKGFETKVKMGMGIGTALININ